MNGRFIFDSVDHRDKRVLQSILGSLPITAEPRLQAPLDRIFEVPHEKGQPMSRKDALDSLVYRVTSSDEYNPKSVYVKIFPVKTPLYQKVGVYQFRDLQRNRVKVTEFWENGSVVLRTQRKGKTYEIGLFTEEQ